MSKHGFFGDFGGQYVPDTLFPALRELEEVFKQLKKDPSFKKELHYYLTQFVGRPTPLYKANRLSEETGYSVYLKREDLNHTGAHKINNTIGQILLAKHMKKTRIIAETGAGQHGVATATACALMGFPCTVYMGEEDIHRQKLNVYRMRLLGAEVISVTKGSRTLKDATTEAIRDWLGSVEDTHYIIGSVVGPHPYPEMVRHFQRVIGIESRKQIMKQEGRLPDVVLACVGGGSNSMGMFHPFIKDKDVRLLAVEAAGEGLDGLHAAALTKGRPGVLHGSRSYLLQDTQGQVQLAHSISAGLDYPGIGPELSYLKDSGRIEVAAVTDTDALDACEWLSQKEGIIPALETSHALAVLRRKNYFKKGSLIVLSLSGRGDKDLDTLMEHLTFDGESE